MSHERVEDGVTKRLVKWKTGKRNSKGRKWRHRWVIVPSKSQKSGS